MWFNVIGIVDRSAQQFVDATAVSPEKRETVVLQRQKLTEKFKRLEDTSNFS